MIIPLDRSRYLVWCTMSACASHVLVQWKASDRYKGRSLSPQQQLVNGLSLCWSFSERVEFMEVGGFRDIVFSSLVLAKSITQRHQIPTSTQYTQLASVKLFYWRSSYSLRSPSDVLLKGKYINMSESDYIALSAHLIFKEYNLIKFLKILFTNYNQKLSQLFWLCLNYK